MNSEPPTGDELNSMLVTMKQNVLERTTESPRRKRNRTLGLGLGLAALLAIGGGSGALALGMLPSPFQAAAPATPTSTPTPTPTVTRTATPRPTPTVAPVVAPVPSAPIDCATLASGVDLSTLIATPAPWTRFVSTPTQAAEDEAGVLTCHWSTGADGYSALTIRVSDDTAAGAAWIARDVSAGANPLAVDAAASSSRCAGESSECQGAVVTDTWWIDVSSADYSRMPTDSEVPLTAALRGILSQLDGLTPTPAWTAPSTSWDTVTDCAALATATPMSTLLGSPRLAGPMDIPTYENDAGSMTEVATQGRVLQCQWYVDPGDEPAGTLTHLPVTLAPGAEWAFGRNSGEPITIVGADEATYTCVSGEGESCFIDLVSDGTYFQIGFGSLPTPQLKSQLVTAAEAIVATRPAS